LINQDEYIKEYSQPLKILTPVFRFVNLELNINISMIFLDGSGNKK